MWLTSNISVTLITVLSSEQGSARFMNMNTSCVKFPLSKLVSSRGRADRSRPSRFRDPFTYRTMGKTSASTVLEIGEESIAALAATSEVNSEQIEALASAVLSVVLGLKDEASALGQTPLKEMDQDFVVRAYNALVCLFLEAAKLDMSYGEMLSFLRSECRLAEGRGDVLSQLFVDRKEGLRALISQTTTRGHTPHLLGADWRLDYCVSSSKDRAIRELLYHVSLNTLDPVDAAEKNINFVCTVEELQDLVARLKDACKSVERALQAR